MLPVSGLTLHVREATGADELVVLEPGRSPVATVVTLASRLTTDAQGRTPAWEELPAADVGAIALTIRQAWLGERISTDARCPHPGCRERMDIAFTIPAYLAHHRPRRYSGLRAGEDAGWFEFAGAPVSFRVPTIADLRAATASADPERCLRERCVHAGRGHRRRGPPGQQRHDRARAVPRRGRHGALSRLRRQRPAAIRPGELLAHRAP